MAGSARHESDKGERHSAPACAQLPWRVAQHGRTQADDLCGCWPQHTPHGCADEQPAADDDRWRRTEQHRCESAGRDGPARPEGRRRGLGLRHRPLGLHARIRWRASRARDLGRARTATVTPPSRGKGPPTCTSSSTRSRSSCTIPQAALVSKYRGRGNRFVGGAQFRVASKVCAECEGARRNLKRAKAEEESLRQEVSTLHKRLAEAEAAVSQMGSSLNDARQQLAQREGARGGWQAGWRRRTG